MQWLEHLIDGLPVRYRVAVRLYYFSELTYEEIAERLRMPMGTVKAILHRGKGRLRKLMEQEGMADG